MFWYLGIFKSKIAQNQKPQNISILGIFRSEIVEKTWGLIAYCICFVVFRHYKLWRMKVGFRLLCEYPFMLVLKVFWLFQNMMQYFDKVLSFEPRFSYSCRIRPVLKSNWNIREHCTFLIWSCILMTTTWLSKYVSGFFHFWKVYIYKWWNWKQFLIFLQYT